MRLTILRSSDLVGYGRRFIKKIPIDRSRKIRLLLNKRARNLLSIRDYPSIRKFADEVNFTPLNHRSIVLFFPFCVYYLKITALIGDRTCYSTSAKSLKCVICENCYYSLKAFRLHFYEAKCLTIPPVLTNQINLELIYPEICIRSADNVQ